MLSGHVDLHARHGVAGWAVDTDSLETRVKVVILVDGQEHGHVWADQPRQDLRDLGTYGDGNHGFSYAFDPPLSLPRSYEIVACFARNRQPLTNGRVHLDVVNRMSMERPQPVLVTTSGQPGLPGLIRSLARDPHIVASESHDYGIRLVSYYAQALDVLTRPHTTEPISSGLLSDENVYAIGPNPYHSPAYEDIFPRPPLLHEFFDRQPRAALCSAFKSILTEFYQTLASHQGKPEPAFFAEQCDLFGVAGSFARLAFTGAREIVLLQDPRDAFCGYRALWSVSPTQAMEMLRRARDRTMQLHGENRSDTWFLRTEDLRLRPEATMAEIASFLGLDHAVVADPATLQIAQAITDPSAQGVGRWKTELDDDEIGLFEREFGEYLRIFGYELAVSTEE